MPAAAYTSSSACTDSAKAFANCLATVIINPILALIFAIALLIFIYGIVEFLWGLTSEAGERDQGRRHMVWGIVGMFIMVAAYTIIKIVANTLNVPLPH